MRKYFLTGILAVICLAGSSYIVLESAGYYRKLYALAGLSGIMGWYTAVLSEIFQLALIILLPTGKENRVKQLTIVLIIALIYVMTVFAAGMNIGKPLIERWSRLLRQETLYGVLLEEQKSLSRQVELFNGQTQRLNTATSIQAQRDSFEEIKSHLKSADTVNEVLTQIELVALWLLRTLIQLANLVCGRFIALNWKEVWENKKIVEDPVMLNSKPKVIRQWKARYTRSDKGFIGIKEFSDGNFVAVAPFGRRKYKSFQNALRFFNGSPFREKIPNNPTIGHGK